MGGHFDIDNLKNQIQILESKINDENIWSDKDRYNEIITELSSLKKQTEDYIQLEKNITSGLELIELLESEDNEELEKELTTEINNLKEIINKEISDLEMESLINVIVI